MHAADLEESELGYLTYSSSATERFTQAELRDLLTTSRRNNTRLGVTGLLLYRDGHFLQYLEAPQRQLTATFEEIRADTRHHGVRLVSTGALAGRIFPQWSMGYKNLAGIRPSNTEGYSRCLQATYRPGQAGDPAERLTIIFYDLIARS